MLGGRRRKRPGAAALPLAPALAVGAGIAALAIARVLTLAPGGNPDAWAYTAWGQALAGLDAPAYGISGTTPKPLAMLLAAAAAPLPYDRAWTIVVALGFGALATALYLTAWRLRGTVAAAVAVIALVLLPRLALDLELGYLDIITVAILFGALATRGRARVGLAVAAGLLRPELWLLAGVAGAEAASGRPRRRLALGALAALAPAALWISFDLAMTGDPLASLHRNSAINSGVPVNAWSRLPRIVLDATVAEAGLVVAVAGAVGLVLELRSQARRRELDLLLAAAVLVLPVAVALTWRELPLIPRYALPFAALSALGAGLLAGRIADRAGRDLPSLAAVGAVLAAAALVLATMGQTSAAAEYAQRAAALDASAPVLRRVAACSPLLVENRQTHLARIIAATGLGGDRFLWRGAPGADRAQASVGTDGTQPIAPPGWVVVRLGIGDLAAAPAVARCAGLRSSNTSIST